MAIESPLGQFFAESGGDEAAIATFNISLQEDIRRCMAEEGFEYFTPQTDTLTASQTAAGNMTREQWVNEYGFGVSTDLDSQVATLSADDNQQYLDTLSEAESLVYLVALYGNHIGSSLANGSGLDPAALPPLAEQGCSGQSLGAASGSTNLGDPTSGNANLVWPLLPT